MNWPESEISIPAVMALISTNTAEGASDIDNSIKPFPEQYAMGAGDVALVSVAGGAMDQDFVVCKIVDVDDDLKTRFPDYEYRLQNSYVPTQWRSIHDPEDLKYGWFSRVRLIPFEQDKWDELNSMILDEGRGDPPDWIVNAFNVYQAKLHESSPDKVGTRVVCGNCGSTKVEIHASQMKRFAANAYTDGNEKAPKYWATRDAGEVSEHVTAHLHCSDCEHILDLDPEEYGFTE